MFLPRLLLGTFKRLLAAGLAGGGVFAAFTVAQSLLPQLWKEHTGPVLVVAVLTGIVLYQGWMKFLHGFFPGHAEEDESAAAIVATPDSMSAAPVTPGPTETFPEEPQPRYDMTLLTLNHASVRLRPFFTEVYEAWLPRMKEQALAFSLTQSLLPSLSYQLDAVLIRQLLDMLLARACAPGVRAALEVSVRNGSMKFAVTDEGPLLQALPSNDRSLCHEIVRLHNGRLWEEQTPHGRKTWVEIPQ